ncbi:MAG: sigma-70 family RNA polymerase sigma factor [Tepidisphaeraceae bacterium]|jgi:RNA polymerase sigma-70 factor (ECF subfamily)
MEQGTADLVIEARRGSHEAFAELIRRYERAALGVAYAITRDAHAAGDVVQEAFLKAWRSLSGLESAGRFEPWLVGIVRNKATDHYRSARRRDRQQGGELPEISADADPSDPLRRQETRRLLADALAGLDETSRMIVSLRYYEGLGGREIGEMLNMSVAAVEMRLSRARRELKEMLEGSDVNPAVGI